MFFFKRNIFSTNNLPCLFLAFELTNKIALHGKLFSDFKSDHSRVVRFRPLVKGNEDPGYEGELEHGFVEFLGSEQSSTRNIVSELDVFKNQITN